MQSTHPFNVFRFCPRCGSSAYESAGKRSLRCSGCGFHFFINSTAAVAALVPDREGRLLLTKRGVEPGYGKLDLPGGFIDPGETAELAVKRELSEELGMDIKSMEYFGSAPNEYVFSGLSVFTLDLAFLIIPVSVEGLVPMDDILGFRFYTKKEIDLEQIPAPSIKTFIHQFFEK